MGLIVLAIVAAALSVAALVQNRASMTAVPAPSLPAVTPSSSPEQTAPSPSVSVSPTASETKPQAPPKVVVIGDSYSVGEPAATWVGPAAAGLGWGEVVNLASPGRGFVTKPRSCNFQPCVNFEESIPLIVKAAPDIVVTFGGAADGDSEVEAAAAAYFKALRKALPDAEIVALTPVSTASKEPAWVASQRQAIAAAVAAVDGTLVDVGQPGIGGGRKLSAEAQKQIAGKVVAQLEAA